MKRVISLLLALVLVMALSACGEKPTEAAAPSDTASANGITVRVVAVHKTTDSNGDPLAAVELEFTNDNADPVSFLGAAQAVVFQGGVEMTASEMFLEQDYDWDSYYTEVKDGATIPVFIPAPLKTDDPVEVKVDIMDYTSWKSVASTTVEMPLS